MPIGTPVANTQLWLAAPTSDGGYRLCGPGEEGEICVTGVAVGLGYLNDPERTRQAFFADPFRPGSRLYRTGDLGVLDSEKKELIYLGRIDRQVKLRGYRIELSEIESVLTQHPGVTAAAVDLRDRPSRRRTVAREQLVETMPAAGTKILVAYVAGATSENDLRLWLADRLPGYMVPDRIIKLAAMPLTRNGKTDFKGLPGPGTRRPELARDYVPPTGETEAAVARAWSDALGVSPVGRDDDFFDLGGESLVAMIIAGGLNARFGTALKISDILDARTTCRLAELIGKQPNTARTGGKEVPADIATGSGGYPLSVHQQGVWFQWKLAPGNAYYNYQGSWSIRGPLDFAALRQAWTRLLSEHPVLLCRFAEDEGQPVLEYPAHDPAELEITDLSGEPADEAYSRFRAQAQAAVQRPFDLSRDELIRARVYRFGREHHELLLSTHEILLDGWAAAVLTGELADHYQAVRAGSPPRAMTDGNDDFSAFLAWEHNRITRKGLARQEQYWREVLAGSLPILRAPADRPRSASPTFRGDSCATVITGQLLEGLHAVSRRHGVTLFAALLAGYGILLARYCGQDDVIIGVPMANRNDKEIHATIGFLINLLPVRLRFDWDQPFSDYLRDVGAQVTKALANCEYPFPWMIQDANVSRSAAVAPVFQTMFNMLNYPGAPPRKDDLAIEFNELETGYTKYDMSLYAQPGSEGEIYLQISFHTDLFDRDTIQRMLDGLLAAYSDIAADDSILIADIQVMDSAHLDAILNAGA